MKASLRHASKKSSGLKALWLYVADGLRLSREHKEYIAVDTNPKMPAPFACLASAR